MAPENPIHPLAPMLFEILMVLTEAPQHGYAIARAIEDRNPEWRTVSPTNLYRRLWDLERQGWIDATGDDQSRKKVFRITRQGRRVASDEAKRLERVVQQAKDIRLLTR